MIGKTLEADKNKMAGFAVAAFLLKLLLIFLNILPVKKILQLKNLPVNPSVDMFKIFNSS